MPIDMSNIALVDPKEGGPTRVGFKFVKGEKVRYAKKSGEIKEVMELIKKELLITKNQRAILSTGGAG